MEYHIPINTECTIYKEHSKSSPHDEHDDIGNWIFEIFYSSFFSTKCLKIKKVPFNLQQNRIFTSRNGSNKHKTIEKNNGNNVATVKKGNRESQQKIIICNQENASVNLKNIFQKPSVSFG